MDGGLVRDSLNVSTGVAEAHRIYHITPPVPHIAATQLCAKRVKPREATGLIRVRIAESGGGGEGCRENDVCSTL